MKTYIYEKRLKKFYKCYLAVQTWNENMKTMNKHMKALRDWEGNELFK